MSSSTEQPVGHEEKGFSPFPPSALPSVSQLRCVRIPVSAGRCCHLPHGSVPFPGKESGEFSRYTVQNLTQLPCRV